MCFHQSVDLIAQVERFVIIRMIDTGNAELVIGQNISVSQHRIIVNRLTRIAEVVVVHKGDGMKTGPSGTVHDTAVEYIAYIIAESI